CVRRALEADVELASIPDAAVVRAALPELERLALTRALATAMLPAVAVTNVAEQLTDLVDQLRLEPEAASLLEAASRGDVDAVRTSIAGLVGAPALPVPLAHHLAVLEWRAAQGLDVANRVTEATVAARGSWLAWMRYLASNVEHQGLLVDHLLAHHRH